MGGLDALADAPRQGRPPTYSPEERAEVVAAALHRPQELNLPFGCWSLDRLTAYLHEHKQIAIKRSRVGELLLEEGLRWRKQETWFGTERVDPDFAKKKRRPSNDSTRNHRQRAWCSASREMGPESAQSYPGVEPLRTAPGPGQPAGRARQEVDYGRRGKGYIFGAFEPRDGRAFTLPYPGRTTANWVDFLQAVDSWVGPEPQEVFAIERQPLDAPGGRRAALFAGLPALAFCVPAHLCGLPQPDRTLVEDVTALSAQRPPL